ncbi:multidrug resistance-associated protein 14 [Actinidia rufa]|uniref:Multidrug resistance-associated protein 14 n=1 Tax=Actinidia rufa TaxID=165716 RepID=A0A7J0EB81_9ERIC|nr:multidrug resistance-associated protein 14 [Actinidia rufa]
MTDPRLFQFSEMVSNWSMGQGQLFCLGRALLRRSKVLVRHRIPTVMDCTMVLAISDGKLVEYDEPTKLMKKEGSMFGQFVREYWSHYHYRYVYRTLISLGMVFKHLLTVSTSLEVASLSKMGSSRRGTMEYSKSDYEKVLK